MTDITLHRDKDGLFFKARSRRGDGWLNRYFGDCRTDANGDVPEQEILDCAERARGEGLIVTVAED